MCQSLREYVTALGYWGFIVIAPITLDIIGVYQLAFDNQFTGIPSWVWFQVAFVLLLIICFIAFHRVRVQRDKALGAEQSLVLTPHAYAIGLSGMTGYPQKPENAAWLRLEVTVNPISKPINTLDLLIGSETIPVNNWSCKIVATFTAYFNVTDWQWKGEHQVELIAKVGGKPYTSGRTPIDFNVEPGGLGRLI